MKLHRKYVLFPLLWLFLSTACRHDRGAGNIDDSLSYEKIVIEKPFAPETMNDVIENISSPVEYASLLKELGVPFNKDFLAKEDVTLLKFDAEKAFALGVYAADLGYLNMYSKTGTIIETISEIRYLARELNLSQFFDYFELKRLATNSNNLDSLIFLSVRSLNNMDHYLRETGRQQLSVLMIYGAWIESLFILTRVSEDYRNERLSEKIGEQKILADQLLLMFNNYSSSPIMNEYISTIRKLKEAFSNVVIKYEKGEPTFIEKDGILTIVQNDKSIVNISDNTLEKITENIKQIRSDLLKGKV
ncbi:MAG: hypothetical protein ACPLXM_11145 [Bacteroidales bacterium]